MVMDNDGNVWKGECHAARGVVRISTREVASSSGISSKPLL